MKGGLLVCTKSFVLDRDLDQYNRAGDRLVAGLDSVDRNHAIVLAHPECFGLPASVRGDSRRSWPRTTSLSDVRRTEPPVGPLNGCEIPELRANAAPPRIAFYISDFNLTAIREEIRGNREFLERGGETGGWLYGKRDVGGGRYGLWPTTLGADGKRLHHRVVLGIESKQAAERFADVHELDDHVFLGAWHVHPYAKGYDEPSPTDRRNTLWRLDQGDLNAALFSLDLIVTPDLQRRYSRPHFHLWHTSRSGIGGRAITVPATFPETLPQWCATDEAKVQA
jgi:hypothetical protein